MIRRRGRKDGEGKERNEKVGYDKKEKAEGGGIRKRGMIRGRGRTEGGGGRDKKGIGKKVC
jgi:hypothetical protein